MRNLTYIIALACFSLLFYGCDKKDSEHVDEKIEEENGTKKDIPEGYFEVVFTSLQSKTPVTGQDARISDLRYLLFKSTGEFVKEKHLVTTSSGVQTWPIATVKDTLPKGSYRAVFVGNTEKTLFPYATSSGPVNYSDVLTGYQSGYASGRILLPPSEFTNNSEYYMSNVTFSDTQANPYILLQRIIGTFNVHRNFVDAQTALNKLVNNIVTQLGYKNLIQNQVQNTLPGLIKGKLDKGNVAGNAIYLVVGGLDAVVNALVGALVQPVTDALYQLFLKDLTNYIGTVLTGNADQAGLLALLGALLNPWNDLQADSAIVSINNFPKSVDFTLTVQDVYPGIQKFKYKLTGSTILNEKDVLIKNFNGLIDVRDVNIVKQGLIGGVIIDQLADGPWLLNGMFVDIKTPVSLTNQTNKRFKNNYSFLDLGLDSYSFQSSGASPLTVSVELGEIPNLTGIVKGIPLLGPILNTTINTLIINPISNIEVTSSVNAPLLGIQKLRLSGGWDNTATQY